uniref:Uncharacterized protein n=1 Tax=Rangifer tarandus platyrhynchus TaxID=3082113 RepID=A0ACB0DYY9_RANTA|nr:unnamed protein product [Rangifer tarandus platyrhynchus]
MGYPEAEADGTAASALTDVNRAVLARTLGKHCEQAWTRVAAVEVVGMVRFQTRSEVKAKRISRKLRCGGVGGGEQGKLTLGFGLISGGDCCWTCEGGFAHEASGGDVEEAGVHVAWSAGKTSGAQTAKFKSYRQTGGLWRYGLKDNRRVGVEREGLWCSILCFHQKQGEGDSAEEMETEMDSPELEAVIL